MRERAGGTPLTLLAVHAHPDDELFGGGALARAADEGVRVVLVTATLGEEGEIHDPDLDAEEARARLGTIREAELRQAAGLLGIADIRILGYRDSGMAGTPANEDPNNFHNADPEAVTAQLVRIMRETCPQVIVTYDERGNYGHPDHIAAHRAAVSAFDAAGDAARFPELELEPWQPLKLYYTAFARGDLLRFREMARERGIAPEEEEPEGDLESYTVPDEMITTRVDVRPWVERKVAAMRVHRTQIPEDSFMLNMSEEMLELVWGRESFIRARSLVETPETEDELFAGLRP
jgi:N-acetyl-1-D-myo-inositol-2-amino-2-deoxy-alpha-D-glucopyranoside deacetylase